ncbi:hypothetical protein I7I50_12526 [Histoplasma capsulatum G186AR]|uniref:Uncharacterized protein n=1 Tax=Ajellomyces capsulatus TaxID=5037 RepID=A0A8H8CRV7_AJECA|nr:hypothetical protein I7I52_11169 [Histoplasma capsulatum]QSS70784.1 hypothetical protein I7I50_12526 [Histoplasma capsulatum G186AR]
MDTAMRKTHNWLGSSPLPFHKLRCSPTLFMVLRTLSARLAIISPPTPPVSGNSMGADSDDSKWLPITLLKRGFIGVMADILID